MKPILKAIIMLVSVLVLTACAADTDSLEQYVANLEKSEYTDLADTGITMQIKEETVTTKTESVTIEFANATDIEYVYGKDLYLEVASDGDWYVIPYKMGCEDVGIILPPHGTGEYNFPFRGYSDWLMPGHYRIIKMFYADGDSVAAAVEFDIGSVD